MRLPRVRLSIRRMMVAVAIVGLLLGAAIEGRGGGPGFIDWLFDMPSAS